MLNINKESERDQIAGKKLYRTPQLSKLGLLSELTQMPSISQGAEGASGKSHKQ